jgi:hypothetical protein
MSNVTDFASKDDAEIGKAIEKIADVVFNKANFKLNNQTVLRGFNNAVYFNEIDTIEDVDDTFYRTELLLEEIIIQLRFERSKFKKMPIDSSMKQLTTAQVAEFFGVDVQTVRNWCDSKYHKSPLKSIQINKKRNEIDVNDLYTFIKKEFPNLKYKVELGKLNMIFEFEEK